MKSPLPAEFVAWLQAYVLSAQFTDVRRLHRGMILRWNLWLDGVSTNALPGYTTPPKPALNGLPAGWSYATFTAIAREAIGTERIYQARRRAASATRPTAHDCGSGSPYGTCPACGKPHGYTVQSSPGLPSASSTAH